MIDKKISEMLNDQFAREFYSAYLYLDFNNYFLLRGLDGFAKWFHVQSREELDHGMMIYDYLHTEDESVMLPAIESPVCTAQCDLDILRMALKHERYITASIHAIYSEACRQQDYRTRQFLDWFVREQAEEESEAGDLITRYQLFASDGKGLYQLDKELGHRRYKPLRLAF